MALRPVISLSLAGKGGIDNSQARSRGASYGFDCHPIRAYYSSRHNNTSGEAPMTDYDHSDSTAQEQEEQCPACSTGCCCGFDGLGGKLQLVLMVAAVVVGFALMVHGFSS